MLTEHARSALMQAEQVEALNQALALLGSAESRHLPVEMTVSLTSVAHAYKALGELQAAAHYLEKAQRWAEFSGSHDTQVRVGCELAELCSDLADQWRSIDPPASQDALERMRDHCFQVAQRAASVSDSDWEVKVLLRVSDVLERCGDHEDACVLQARAMRLMVGERGALPPPDLHLLRQPLSD